MDINLTIFLGVLAFATISSPVVVFLIDRIIRYDEKWLSDFKNVFIKSEKLKHITLESEDYNGNKITNKSKDKFLKSVHSDWENPNIEIENKISPFYLDNVFDVLTADIKRARFLFEKYKILFYDAFKGQNITLHFYKDILERIKYNCHNLLKINISIFLTFTCILVFFSWMSLYEGLSNCVEQQRLITFVASLCIFLQVILFAKIWWHK